MKFECGDLDRALANPELMPEAREHLKQCSVCRREYRLWTEMSAAARELHEEWASPDLWGRIRGGLESVGKAKPVWWKDWRTWAVAAIVLIAAVAGTARMWERAVPGTQTNPLRVSTTSDRDFLTDQALADVEKTEAAYRESIDKLFRLATPKLDHATSPIAVNCREKLVMLDSAIEETRASLDQNRFNVRLQTELANLYRQKQETLKELLTRDQKN